MNLNFKSYQLCLDFKIERSSKQIKYGGIPLLNASLQANSKDECLYLANNCTYGRTRAFTSDCVSNVAGFSLHAGVMSNAQDRCKLERLCG